MEKQQEIVQTFKRVVLQVDANWPENAAVMDDLLTHQREIILFLQPTLWH